MHAAAETQKFFDRVIERTIARSRKVTTQYGYDLSRLNKIRDLWRQKLDESNDNYETTKHHSSQSARSTHFYQNPGYGGYPYAPTLSKTIFDSGASSNEQFSSDRYLIENSTMSAYPLATASLGSTGMLNNRTMNSYQSLNSASFGSVNPANNPTMNSYQTLAQGNMASGPVANNPTNYYNINSSSSFGSVASKNPIANTYQSVTPGNVGSNATSFGSTSAVVSNATTANNINIIPANNNDYYDGTFYNVASNNNNNNNNSALNSYQTLAPVILGVPASVPNNLAMDSFQAIAPVSLTPNSTNSAAMTINAYQAPTAPVRINSNPASIGGPALVTNSTAMDSYQAMSPVSLGSNPGSLGSPAYFMNTPTTTSAANFNHPAVSTYQAMPPVSLSSNPASLGSPALINNATPSPFQTMAPVTLPASSASVVNNNNVIPMTPVSLGTPLGAISNSNVIIPVTGGNYSTMPSSPTPVDEGDDDTLSLVQTEKTSFKRKRSESVPKLAPSTLLEEKRALPALIQPTKRLSSLVSSSKSGGSRFTFGVGKSVDSKSAGSKSAATTGTKDSNYDDHQVDSTHLASVDNDFPPGKRAKVQGEQEQQGFEKFQPNDSQYNQQQAFENNLGNFSVLPGFTANVVPPTGVASMETKHRKGHGIQERGEELSDTTNTRIDLEEDGEVENLEGTNDVALCTFVFCDRKRNKNGSTFKFHLKNGIMHINGKDIVFSDAIGEGFWGEEYA